MTTRKEKQEQEAMANLFVWSILALFGLLGLVLLPFTGIFAYFQWRKIKSKLFRPNMIRIHEGSFKEALQTPISERWGKQICLNE